MTEQDKTTDTSQHLETNAPINFRGKLFLTSHAIQNGAEYHSTKSGLKSEMISTFISGQNNVILLEDASGAMHTDKDFAEGFNLFGSYVAAIIYRSFKRQGQPPELLTKEGLLAFWERVKGQIHIGKLQNMSESLAWGATVYEVVDELRGEGTDIDIVFEKSIEPASRKVGDLNTLEGYKIEWQAAYDHIKQRDAAIAAQITNILTSAAEPLNLLIIVGSSHYDIANQLPTVYKSNIEITGNQFDDWDQNKHRFRKQLMSKVQRGLPVRDRLWRGAFEETRKYG